MSEEPLVSIILPVYNTEKYVEESLNSVFNQTYKNIEVICVNDGSTDGSLEILKKMGKKIILIDSPQNGGIAKARNQGIEIAKGEFLAFMDADDIWKENKIELQIENLKNDPELDISFTWMQCFISPELPKEIKELRYCNTEPTTGYISGTAVVKTKSFKEVGNFDPKWRVGEFIDWFGKAKEKGLKYEMIKEVLFLRRIHETNTGVREKSSRNDYLKIIKEMLDRKKNK